MADEQDLAHQVVDLTAEGAPAAAPVDPDVVVLPEDGQAQSGLPKSAVLQPDGSVILTLRYPVVMKWKTAGTDAVREDKRTTLTMYRLNGLAMKAVMNAGRGDIVTTGIAQSCRMNQSRFDAIFARMDAVDTTAAAQVFDFFVNGGEATAPGQPSSP